LRSWRVVRSGARKGGFWFHVGCSKSSSVLDGRFMVGSTWGVVLDLRIVSSNFWLLSL
jgi:hypothetical protein